MVLSRTNGVAGPFTISISIAGICEISPSFVSVLNALGLFLSYNRTERYRQELIAQRERRGRWDVSEMDEVVIRTFQFDNWDIKPLHAVKLNGKAMPKVNGSLLEGQSRKRVRGKSEGWQNEIELKIQRHSSWRSREPLGSRETFTDSLANREHEAIIRQFQSVVLGMSSLCRRQLLGGLEGANAEHNTGTRDGLESLMHHRPVNFRTLMLSCFKPHGGRNLGTELWYHGYGTV